MSMSVKFSHGASVGGKNFSGSRTISGEGQTVVEAEVAAAKVGELTTRTDNDTGVITAVTGHGIVDTDVIDVFWADGSRRGMTADVTGDAITVDGGSGDNLPALNTDVTFMKRTTLECPFVGNNLVYLAMASEARGYGHFSIQDGSSEHAFYRTSETDKVKDWNSGDGSTNPVAGDSPTKFMVSHGDSTGARKMRAAVLFS